MQSRNPRLIRLAGDPLRACDTALHERAIRAVENGSSIRAVPTRFGPGVATAARWVQRWREHGTLLEPTVRSAPAPVLEEHAEWLAQLREVEPSLSCQAVVDRLAEERGLRVHETTPRSWLRRHGITQNKSLVASEHAHGDVAPARWLWHRG